jgi:membrane protease YdiL (CAAX protease family)
MRFLVATGGFGKATQVLLSGLLFGLPHVVWGFFSGSFHVGAALGAIAGTTVLGALFASAYLIGGRSLIPCITAHALLNVVIEPWLAYSARVSSS